MEACLKITSDEDKKHVSRLLEIRKPQRNTKYDQRSGGCMGSLMDDGQ